MVVVYLKYSECGSEHFWLNQTEVPLNVAKYVKSKLIEVYSLSWKEVVF